VLIAEARRRLKGVFAYLPVGVEGENGALEKEVAKKILDADKNALGDVVSALSFAELQSLPYACASNSTVNLRLRDLADRIVLVNAALPKDEHNRRLRAMQGKQFDEGIFRELSDIADEYAGATGTPVVVTCVREQMLGGITIMAADLTDRGFHTEKTKGTVGRIVFPGKSRIFRNEKRERVCGKHNRDDLVVSMLRSADKYQQHDSENQRKEFNKLVKSWTDGKENVCTGLLLQFFNCEPPAYTGNYWGMWGRM
jgi:hypothetical protein